MARRKRFTGAEICAYCNAQPGRPGAGDHVIPRCLFDDRRESTITVPACAQCNGEKADDEGYVRDWLCADIEVDLSVVPRSVYNNFMGSAARGSSSLARAAVTQGQFEARFTESRPLCRTGALLQF